jgi:hypothetical protein
MHAKCFSEHLPRTTLALHINQVGSIRTVRITFYLISQNLLLQTCYQLIFSGLSDGVTMLLVLPVHEICES